MNSVVKRKAIFLDRDGVLNFDVGFTHKIEDLKLINGVGEALLNLKKLGFLLIVITNQSGVARGYYKTSDVENFHAAMQEQLREKFGVQIDAFYYCPHFAGGSEKEFAIACECRK